MGKKLTFTALFSGNATRSLKVVESENILNLSLSVDNITVTIFLSLLDLLDQELLNIVWLLVAQQSGQVLCNYKLEMSKALKKFTNKRLPRKARKFCVF